MTLHIQKQVLIINQLFEERLCVKKKRQSSGLTVQDKLGSEKTASLLRFIPPTLVGDAKSKTKSIFLQDFLILFFFFAFAFCWDYWQC
uniref:Uncharacterized protein n=1 Tax=Anguilla anguilla TaxID=7936 RepID=A0A0E9TQ55_ANGAN